MRRLLQGNTDPLTPTDMAQEEEVLQAFTSLCTKIEKMIDISTARMDELEAKITKLERKPTAIYTQQEVAKLTGWSVAAVNEWVRTGYIKSVRVRGRKNLWIPASEVEMILFKQGYGKNHKKRD